MATEKPGRSGDRHKKQQTQFRMHPVIRAQLVKLCERNMTTMTTEITEAIRNHLAAEGLWPPPAEGK